MNTQNNNINKWVLHIHTWSMRECDNDLGLIQDSSVQLSVSADISDRDSVVQSVVIGLSWSLP